MENMAQFLSVTDDEFNQHLRILIYWDKTNPKTADYRTEDWH